MLLVFGLSLHSLHVESLVALRVLFFLGVFCADLSTFLADSGLEVVISCWVFHTLLLPRQYLLFNSLLVKGILVAIWDRLRWLLSFVKNLFAVRVGRRFESVLLLNLLLDLLLLLVDEFFSAILVLRHTSLHRFETSDHFLGLAAHRFRLKGAPFGLLEDSFFLQVNNFLTRLFWLPKIALVVCG